MAASRSADMRRCRSVPTRATRGTRKKQCDASARSRCMAAARRKLYERPTRRRHRPLTLPRRRHGQRRIEAPKKQYRDGARDHDACRRTQSVSPATAPKQLRSQTMQRAAAWRCGRATRHAHANRAARRPGRIPGGADHGHGSRLSITQVNTHMCTDVFICIHMFTHAYACVCVCIHVYMYTHVCVFSHVRICVHVCTCVHVYICAHVCMHVDICTDVYTRSPVHACM